MNGRAVRGKDWVSAQVDDNECFIVAPQAKSGGWMLPFYPNGRLVSLGECGHYPMQEQPPLLATLIERFLSD
ncbi:MAG: hypothetical protein QOJ51_2655 [Acidobacteriaceae bacterium]|jgi:hypothetical protein|nr:hypothetical protein [Acidobacteriaceae bacterium]